MCKRLATGLEAWLAGTKRSSSSNKTAHLDQSLETISISRLSGLKTGLGPSSAWSHSHYAVSSGAWALRFGSISSLCESCCELWRRGWLWTCSSHSFAWCSPSSCSSYTLCCPSWQRCQQLLNCNPSTSDPVSQGWWRTSRKCLRARDSHSLE